MREPKALELLVGGVGEAAAVVLESGTPSSGAAGGARRCRRDRGRARAASRCSDLLVARGRRSARQLARRRRPLPGAREGRRQMLDLPGGHHDVGRRRSPGSRRARTGRTARLQQEELHQRLAEQSPEPGRGSWLGGPEAAPAERRAQGVLDTPGGALERAGRPFVAPQPCHQRRTTAARARRRCRTAGARPRPAPRGRRARASDRGWGTPYSVAKASPQPAQRSAAARLLEPPAAVRALQAARGGRARRAGRARAGGLRARAGAGARRAPQMAAKRVVLERRPPRRRASAPARRRAPGRAGATATPGAVRDEQDAHRAAAVRHRLAARTSAASRVARSRIAAKAASMRSRGQNGFTGRMRIGQQRLVPQARAEQGVELVDGEEVALDVRAADVDRDVRQEAAQADRARAPRGWSSSPHGAPRAPARRGPRRAAPGARAPRTPARRRTRRRGRAGGAGRG